MHSCPKNFIYTACTGRCGQHSLGDYINRCAFDTLVEVEPPTLIYPTEALFGNYLRNFQRKWLVTDEMLGRGNALQWYRDDDRKSLKRLSKARLSRAKRLCRKKGYQTYFEISKFFIRSYYDTTQEIQPDIGVLLLKRDPMNNARSFANRNKNFSLDNQLPNEDNVILYMDTSNLSLFQLYLWQWCEVELRSLRFIKSKNITRFYELYNFELDDPLKLCEMLDFFSIEHLPIETVPSLRPLNTNTEIGFEQTKVTTEDFVDFENFLDMLPTVFLDELGSLIEWHVRYKAAGF